jgi:hypothetical protein
LKEVRTEAVDRLLEALSPALTAELDRVVDETRQRLEAEFESRLQASIRHAEEAVRVAAENDRQVAIDRAVEEAREVVRTQIANELQSEFERRLEEARDAVRSQISSELQVGFDRRLQEVNAEGDRLRQEIAEWRVLAESQKRLSEATSQAEILLRWLNLVEPFVGAIAVYVAKADGLALWKSRGSGVFQQIISQQTTDPESYFKPIAVRGKTVAAVCALPPYRTEVLDFLTTTLERAIELFGFRLRNK